MCFVWHQILWYLRRFPPSPQSSPSQGGRGGKSQEKLIIVEELDFGIILRTLALDKGRGQGEGLPEIFCVLPGSRFTSTCGVFHPHLNPRPPEEGEEEMFRIFCLRIFLIIDLWKNLVNVLDL